MLDGAVCGKVFASPSSTQIFETMKAVSTDHRGILLIVKNYSGDRLHFGTACERAKRELDQDVQMVLVEEDCAIPRPRIRGTGRRGLAGTVLVHKVAGAAARHGNSLAEVARRANLVANSIGTVGVALPSCSVS
ncbi:hypothetical protein SeLEV6574_g07527 [Synchytrium endobioticum]|nr:hypothetical protein SeLEV6574_g07527 [Synchytrium endobioticum]